MSCDATYKPDSKNKTCQCAPGYFRVSAADPCQACGTGKWCAGGDDSLTANACGAGLSTLIPTASRADQCVTLPGFGYDSAADKAVADRSTAPPLALRL